jgi:hypothetical protein
MKSKHRNYRARMKATAIAAKGGVCAQCGFADERALRFHHVKPVRRGRNGIRKRDQTSTESHRLVVRGDGKGLVLLCANCSCIRTSKLWTLSVNIKRAARAVTR